MIKIVAACAILALSAAACGGKKEMESSSKQDRYYVLKDGKRVEWIENKPGIVGSQAAPDPKAPPTTSFMTSVSLNAFEEDPLGKILARSKTFDEYVAGLKKGGYTLEATTERP